MDRYQVSADRQPHKDCSVSSKSDEGQKIGGPMAEKGPCTTSLPPPYPNGNRSPQPGGRGWSWRRRFATEIEERGGRTPAARPLDVPLVKSVPLRVRWDVADVEQECTCISKTWRESRSQSVSLTENICSAVAGTARQRPCSISYSSCPELHPAYPVKILYGCSVCRTSGRTCSSFPAKNTPGRTTCSANARSP